MLQAARAKLAEGIDVVAGVVETHGRQETEALLDGLPLLPKAKIPYRETAFEEFDLAAMLERDPQIALIDELAHTNVPGSRHPKRYQDVRELLDAGIHVYTTVNVQHLESRAESVEQLTGAPVRERVPDTVLEWADEIEIIDISPEGLRHRLGEGKVYLGDKAASAVDRFFTERNLAALREMALRSTAERVNRDLIHVLKQERASQPLPTGERVLVAVGSSPYSESLIRWTKRYADSLHASWLAVHVEAVEPLPEEAQQRLRTNLEFARSLGAEIHSTSGEKVSEAILRTAQRELVTQIVAGRSPQSWWKRLTGGSSLTEKLIADSGTIAIHVLPSTEKPRRIRWELLRSQYAAEPRQWWIAFGLAVGLGALSYPVREVIGHWTVALLFLSLTTVGGFLLRRGPVFLLALLSALGWNFFFVPPQFTFHIDSPQDVLLFVVLLLVAVLMGQLTARLQRLNEAERRRELRAHALYRFLDDLNAHNPVPDVLTRAIEHITEVCQRPAAYFPSGAAGLSGQNRFPTSTPSPTRDEQGVIDWVLTNAAPAGAGTSNLPDRKALYLPVGESDSKGGVLRILGNDKDFPITLRDLLFQMTRALGRFMEREDLRVRARQADVLEASKHLQKTLLDTVSHELKTPLTVIIGSVKHVQSQSVDPVQTTLLKDASQSAERLLRNVNMLLDLTRFEGGKIQPFLTVIDLHDLWTRLRSDLTLDFPDFPQRVQLVLPNAAPVSDEGLLYQLLNQLLRNALTYAPEGPVEMVLAIQGERLQGSVRDRGPGLPEDISSLFEPFSHGAVRRSRGLGLGLSIAARICETLDGKLEADNHPQGGARFAFDLPNRTHAN